MMGTVKVDQSSKTQQSLLIEIKIFYFANFIKGRYEHMDTLLGPLAGP